MALPTTDITTTHVRNALGESFNRIYGFFASPNVNYFGFNSPSSLQNNNFWGKADESQTNIGYPLGAFRGYDHDWMTHMMGGRTRVSDDDPFIPIEIRISIPPAASFLLSKPDVTIDHVFSVRFSRANDFGSGGGTYIVNNATKPISLVTTSFSVSFSTANPPDGGAALEPGDPFFIQVIHESSPGRRWWISGSDLTTSNNGGDAYITEFSVPLDPASYYLGIYDVGATVNIYNGRTDAVNGSVTIQSDLRASATATVEIQLCESSAFDVDVNSISISPLVPDNTSNLGTDRYDTFSFTGNALLSWSLNDTIYYRARITNVVGGTVNYDTVWSTTQSTTVVDEFSQG